jgi:biotin synthase
VKQIIDKLVETHDASYGELLLLLQNRDSVKDYLLTKSRELAVSIFGHKIFVRGLIEFTNYCKNDCYYCGIQRSNKKVDRYRLTKEEILSCCQNGYSLGMRTFVLQGGEDIYYTDDRMVDIIQAIREGFPDCAITLSFGEKSKQTYQKYFDAGADRYLLRHETSNPEHYRKLHPANLSIEKRKQCLRDLKEIGFQVGAGFMVGSPYQTLENLVEDLVFIKELSPEMIGTPFGKEKAGTMELTLFLIGILRLMNPMSLIPATTALGTINPNGREQGILAGANILMPNLSPVQVRKKYSLYDNKICTGEEAAECKVCLDARIHRIGYHIVIDRGDFIVV